MKTIPNKKLIAFFAKIFTLIFCFTTPLFAQQATPTQIVHASSSDESSDAEENAALSDSSDLEDNEESLNDADEITGLTGSDDSTDAVSNN